MAKQMDLSEVGMALSNKYNEFLFSSIATNKVQEALDDAERILYHGDLSDSVVGAVKQLKKDKVDFINRTEVLIGEFEEMAKAVEPKLREVRDDYSHYLLGVIGEYRKRFAAFEIKYGVNLGVSKENQ